MDLSFLSPEQREVVESWGQGMAVVAGAGSGKTTTLVTKCQALIERNPDARFAAVSFTEKSAGDLREKLSARLPAKEDGGPLSGHWVTTIHGLCGSIIREFPREAGFDGEERVLSQFEAQSLWDRAVEALWLEDVPTEIEEALERVLLRENRRSLLLLLTRMLDLEGFGVFEKLQDSDDADTQALAMLGLFCFQRYDRLKRRSGGLDFSDLERGANRALEHENVRRAYHERFDLVLVDEFQDTNPVQADIIWRLIRPEASNLCVVGDPKQSIYRFRDADVSVFEECCRRLPKQVTLSRNYRSRPGIIDFANTVCEPLFEASEMRYDALVPQREANASFDPVCQLKIQQPEDLARWILSENKRGVPLHEMALLLRKIRGNEKWLKALSGAGIPLAIGSGGLFWEDPRVRELTSFLRWWFAPENTLSGAVFLRAPWVAISDQELDRWILSDPTWQKPFFDSGHRIAQALAPLRDRVLRPSELLMALLIDSEIEKELGAPLLALWHRCEELSSQGPQMSANAVVDELYQAMQEKRRERDVPPPRNEGQLVVLTLHGAKGLEFPHVILVDLPAKPATAKASPLLFWDRERGAFLGKRAPDGSRDKAAEKIWRKSESEKSLAESKRVFYVALTRPQERLILAQLDPPENPSPLNPEEARARDFWRGWIDVCSSLKVPEAPPIAEVMNDQIALPFEGVGTKTHRQYPRPVVYQRSRHSVTEWNTLARCPRAYEWKFIRPRQEEPATEVSRRPEQGGALTSGSRIDALELGRRVHAGLEMGDDEALAQIEAEVGSKRFRAKPLIQWKNQSPWMNTESGVRPVSAWNELGFEFQIGGETLVGALDRVVQLDSGEFVIIDFKISGAKRSKQDLLETYQNQLKLYVAALERLEPASKNRTRAVLVSITPDGVEEIEVPIQEESDPFLEHLSTQAKKIIAGSPGIPNPGERCARCEFRSSCNEAQTHRAY